MTDLSDKALAVFAFALHHQLESGEHVSGVVGDDGAGHRADPEAVAELEQRGLAHMSGNRVVFTPEGLDHLEAILRSIREATQRA